MGRRIHHHSSNLKNLPRHEKGTALVWRKVSSVSFWEMGKDQMLQGCVSRERTACLFFVFHLSCKCWIDEIFPGPRDV